jgi:hypothetical protein
MRIAAASKCLSWMLGCWGAVAQSPIEPLAQGEGCNVLAYIVRRPAFVRIEIRQNGLYFLSIILLFKEFLVGQGNYVPRLKD